MLPVSDVATSAFTRLWKGPNFVLILIKLTGFAEEKNLPEVEWSLSGPGAPLP
jgi:hypothetical protein